MESRSYYTKSKTTEYETPQDLFDKLDEEFSFTLDPCATPENAKCKKFYTKEDNGLAQDWSTEIVFMNPPYGRDLYQWVKKASDEWGKGAIVVALLPVRTDTKWFHYYVYNQNTEIRFLKGRLKFEGTQNSAPFPSMVVIWR